MKRERERQNLGEIEREMGEKRGGGMSQRRHEELGMGKESTTTFVCGMKG